MERSVALRELPGFLQQALANVGYRRPDIVVETGETFSPSEGSSVMEGNRGFVIAVNLETGSTKEHFGAWGGATPFDRRQVDHDRGEHPIPPNGAVVIGSTGGRGAFARIRVRPEAFPKMLPSGDEPKATDEERKALAVIKGTKSGYRKDEFRRKGLGDYSVENPVIQSLIAKKFLVANRAGAIQITTAGKNALGEERVR